MSIRDEARAEYVRRSIGPSVGTIGDRLRAAWDAGAKWAATSDPTDAEVEAAAKALAIWDGATGWGTSAWSGEIPQSSYMSGARQALRAAREVTR